MHTIITENKYDKPQLKYMNLELEGFICGSGEVDEFVETGEDDDHKLIFEF